MVEYGSGFGVRQWVPEFVDGDWLRVVRERGNVLSLSQSRRQVAQFRPTGIYGAYPADRTWVAELYDDLSGGGVGTFQLHWGNSLTAYTLGGDPNAALGLTQSAYFNLFIDGTGGNAVPFVYPIVIPLTWPGTTGTDALEYFHELPTHLLFYGSNAAYVVLDAAGTSDYHPDLIEVPAAASDRTPTNGWSTSSIWRLSGPDITRTGRPISAVGDAYFEGFSYGFADNAVANSPVWRWAHEANVGGLAVRRGLFVEYTETQVEPGAGTPGAATLTIEYFDCNGASVGTQLINLTLSNGGGGNPVYSDNATIMMEPPSGAYMWTLTLPTPTTGCSPTLAQSIHGRVPLLPFCCHDVDGNLVGPGRMVEVV